MACFSMPQQFLVVLGEILYDCLFQVLGQLMVEDLYGFVVATTIWNNLSPTVIAAQYLTKFQVKPYTVILCNCILFASFCCVFCLCCF